MELRATCPQGPSARKVLPPAFGFAGTKTYFRHFIISTVHSLLYLFRRPEPGDFSLLHSLSLSLVSLSANGWREGHPLHHHRFIAYKTFFSKSWYIGLLLSSSFRHRPSLPPFSRPAPTESARQFAKCFCCWHNVVKKKGFSILYFGTKKFASL